MHVLHVFFYFIFLLKMSVLPFRAFSKTIKSGKIQMFSRKNFPVRNAKKIRNSYILMSPISRIFQWKISCFCNFAVLKRLWRLNFTKTRTNFSVHREHPYKLVFLVSPERTISSSNVKPIFFSNLADASLVGDVIATRRRSPFFFANSIVASAASVA